MECKLIPECDDLPSTALCGIPPRTGALWSAPRSNHPSQTSLQGTSLRTGFTLLSLTTSTLHAIVFRHKRWAGYSLKHLTAWSTIPSQPTPRSNNRGTKSYIFVYQTVKNYATCDAARKTSCLKRGKSKKKARSDSPRGAMHARNKKRTRGASDENKRQATCT